MALTASLNINSPKNIFKYQPINDYSLENLKDQRLWASEPSAFNDPFEYNFSQIVVNPKGSELAVFIERIHMCKVVCLTARPDNLLMWSHYSNNHKGLCLGFYHYTVSTRVHYTNQFPKVDFNEINQPSYLEISIVNILHTKSPEWSYEEERRMTYVSTTDSKVDYPGPLFLVIFGMRTSNEDIDKVKSLIADKDVLFWKCKMVPGYYKIDFEGL